MSDEIVVGVDGSPGAEAALRWAVNEAWLRGVGVRAVLAWAPDGRPWAVDEAAESMRTADLEASARRFLDALVAAVPPGEPPVDIRPEPVHAPPVEALTAAAGDAPLLVVGARGLGGFASLLVGSVSQGCAHHAAVPLVVVRHEAEGSRRPDAPVVVGVDGSARSVAALRFAAGEAALRGVDLDVVHAWTAVPPLYPGIWFPIDTDAVERAARDALAETVRAGLGPDPGPTVTARVVGGPSAPVLLAAAEEAQLLVVGSRGRGGFAGLLLGSTSQQCLSHAGCPVAVVRHGSDEGGEEAPPAG